MESRRDEVESETTGGRRLDGERSGGGEGLRGGKVSEVREGVGRQKIKIDSGQNGPFKSFCFRKS